MRRLAPLLSLLCATCVTPREPVDSTLSVSLTALSLVDVGDVLWDIQVRNGASDVVWSRRVASSRSGDGAGSALWIGPCDGSTTARDHTVEVWVVGLYDAPVASPGQFAAGQTTGLGSVSAPSLPFVSPTATAPLVRAAICQPNADTLVDFDITLLRPAQQGFFDVAVSLSSVFCSAKFDCCDTDTGACPGDGSLDHRLLFDETGARASTFVLGFACAADPSLTAQTQLYLDALQLDCTSPTGESFTADLALNPSGPPGNQCTPGNLSACPAITESNLDADTYLYQLGVYRGTQTLASDPPVDMVYWNLALGVRRPAIASCHLRLRGSADDAQGTPLVTAGRVSPGIVYPYIAWDVDLGTCGQEPLSYDGSSMVSTRYTALDGAALSFAYGYGSGQVSGPFCDPTCVRGECVGGTCLCPDGYSGPACEIAANPCATNPCQNAGTCAATTPLIFTCACPPTHTGPLCADLAPPPDPCAPNPCLNTGTCTPTGDTTFTCACPPTHTGPLCADLVQAPDACTPDPCQNGTCVPVAGSYFCDCPPTHLGDLCELPVTACAPNPCANGGTCSLAPDGFVCDCPAGYGGLDCETELPCGLQPTPCEAGTFCTAAGVCLPNGTVPNETPVSAEPSSSTLLPGGTETFTLADGNAPYTVAIESGGGDLDFDTGTSTATFTAPAEPGQTTLRVTDAFGATFDVVIDTTPPLGLAPPAVLVSSTTTLVASGGLGPYTLENLGPGTLVGTAFTAPAAPTSTSIRVTDAAGNSLVAPLTIHGPLTLSPTSTDVATNGTVAFTASGGFLAHNFTVSSGQGSFSGSNYIAPASAGSATVTVTDQLGNTATSNVNIYLPLVISPSAPTVETSATLVFAASGGVGSYTFTKVSGVGSLAGSTYTAPTTAGTAAVRVTDGLGNTRTANITIIAAAGGACASSPCLNGGICSLDPEAELGYACECIGEYSGDNCEVEPPPCGSSGLPCEPGYFCTEVGVCLPDGTTPNPTPVLISPTSASILVSASRAFSASGGNPPYTFFLGSGDGTVSGSTFTAPAYASTSTVTVRDAFGATSSATVDIRPLLQISPTSATIAVNGSLTFSATGGIGSYTFTRQSGGGSLSASTYTAPATTGSAVIRVTDSAGNRSDATVTIANFAIVPTNPTVLTSGSLVFSASGGTAPYSYAVTSGGGSFIGSTYTAPATPGTANVRVTSQNGWTANTSVTIVAPLAINPSAPLVMAGRSQTFTTSGGSGTVVFSKTSGEGALVGSTFTAPMTPGHATIRATDAANNTADAAVTIYPVLELAPEESYVLSGDVVVFSATGGYGAYTYSVVSGGGTFSGSSYTASGAAGPSLVRVTDALGNTASAVVTIYGYTQIDTGGTSTTSAHACGVRSDGTLWCWGHNSVGQIGDGTILAKNRPTKIGADDWLQVSAGELHTCAIKTNRTLYCWGEGAGYRLGDGTLTDRNAPTLIGTDTDWFEVSAGNSHTCGIKTDGSLWCWGLGSSYQLGNGSNSSLVRPTRIGTENLWSSVSAAQSNATCATKTNGTLWCWGANTTGIIGNGTTTTATLPVRVMSSISTWSRVSAGLNHACATRTDGTLWCWGQNTYYQTGDSTTTANRTTPIQVGAALGPFAGVAPGTDSTCAVLASGALYCWGRNHFGQIGDGSTVNRTTPTRVGTGTDWSRIAVGNGHACASTSQGTLSCWGWDSFGQLGVNGSAAVRVPALVSSGWTNVAASDQNHTCATRQDGTVWCWGWANYGQIGDSTTVMKTRPVPVAGGATDFTAVAQGLGRYHSCAHKNDDRLFCWGRSYRGALGTGNTTTQNSPVAVLGGAVWDFAAPGFYHTCALRTNGTLWCWGMNDYGQIGNGAAGTTTNSTPLQVGTVTTWDHVASGQYHSCATRANGTLWCWGRNNYYQLGDGTVTTRTTPVQVGAAHSWSRVSVGQYHGCGVLADDTLRCWGNNGSGRLGDGTTTNRTTSVAIEPTSTWNDISLGYTYSCGIKSDASLWCWGVNTYGQLGVGDLTARNRPTRVGADNDWVEVTAGQYHTCGLKADGRLFCWGRNLYGGIGTTDKCADATIYCQLSPVVVQ